MTTLAQRVDTVTAFLRAFWQLAILAGALVAVLFLVRACNRADTAEAALARANETAELAEAGFVVAVETDRKALDAQAAQIPSLEAEIARLRKASPGVRIVYVDRVVTAPATAEGVPRPPEAPGAPAPVCLWAWGDTGELRINRVGLETRDGVQIALVDGEAWRLTPAPPTRILAGIGSAPLSTSTAEPVPLVSRPGWGGGALAGISTSGLTGGVMILSPPLLGDHLSAVGTVQLGAGPSGSILAGLIWR